ncbi:hypothetical protein GCM10023172_40400 [Hymenobacter ginsengisoli]|uniref:STAS/SEC14 domain-containing protein n=1 Tax=Hymenobacter ginsengisoli TaxID=1051626 RepID=A0ABP8QS40_9BACT|nr:MULTISPECIES: hypothetical protein [unclassified Hymenobacter]MBO2032316.1 hypothetical protein [Hymenobacter sp. BT559]
MPAASPAHLVYFQNAVARLLEHPHGYAVVEYQPGPRQLPDLQGLLAQLAQLLTQRRWNRVLADQRNMQPYSPEESDWIRDHWLTRGTTFHGAVLLPHDVFARLTSSQLVLEAKAASLSYRLFDDQADAEAWLGKVA